MNKFVELYLVKAGVATEAASEIAKTAYNIELKEFPDCKELGFTVAYLFGYGDVFATKYWITLDKASFDIIVEAKDISDTTEYSLRIVQNGRYLYGTTNFDGLLPDTLAPSFENMSTDELVDMYCDWGAMGKEMDCSSYVFSTLSNELNKRN